MLKSYGRVNVFSPSWMVKYVGEKAYVDLFDRLAGIRKPGKLLDIGCGGGEKKEVLPDDADYVGVDHSECPHERSSIDFYSTAYSIAVKDASFDTVFCSGVLEHLEEPEMALKEAFRVLRPGGIAIYSIPLFWHLHEEPRDFYRYTKYGIRHLFEKVGFETEQISPLSGFWITFGSEFSYYLSKFGRGVLKPVVSMLIALNNLIFFGLEKFLPVDDRWTWMYLVVAQKRITSG